MSGVGGIVYDKDAVYIDLGYQRVIWRKNSKKIEKLKKIGIVHHSVLGKNITLNISNVDKILNFDILTV